MESPDFWHFISQLGTVLYWNHIVPARQRSAAHEILKIIVSPLVYTLTLTEAYKPFRSERRQTLLFKSKHRCKTWLKWAWYVLIEKRSFDETCIEIDLTYLLPLHFSNHESFCSPIPWRYPSDISDIPVKQVCPAYFILFVVKWITAESAAFISTGYQSQYK